QRRRKSAPVRSTSQRSPPQGWGFFITSVSPTRISISLFPLYALPVGLRGLLGLVVAVVVVLRAHDVVRQVLLPPPVAGEVVRVFIALLALKARAVGVYVLQLARIGPGLARAHVRHGGVDAHHHAVRLGGGGQQYGGLRQRQPRLRQAQLQR